MVNTRGHSRTRLAPVRRAWNQACRRWRSGVIPVLQQTAAAAIAWWIANLLGNHPDPFFAPLAAVIALNAPVGERGLNALRMLVGVVIGIITGELAIILLPGGYGSLTIAAFTGMSIAVMLGGARLVIAQAAAGAILTIGSADGDVGLYRLMDAMIGGGVALVFSQFLFTPEPVSLLRRAQAVMLKDLAQGLELTVTSLQGDDPALQGESLVTMRSIRSRMVELARLRSASSRIARQSAMWRAQRASAQQESESASLLQPLGESCLMLTRTSLKVPSPERAPLLAATRQLAATIADLATDLGELETRQRAAIRALEVARYAAADDTSGEPSFAVAMTFVRMVATDIMVYAGVDRAEAETAILARHAAVVTSEPPVASLVPFGVDRWRARIRR